MSTMKTDATMDSWQTSLFPKVKKTSHQGHAHEDQHALDSSSVSSRGHAVVLDMGTAGRPKGVQGK